MDSNARGALLGLDASRETRPGRWLFLRALTECPIDLTGHGRIDGGDATRRIQREGLARVFRGTRRRREQNPDITSAALM